MADFANKASDIPVAMPEPFGWDPCVNQIKWSCTQDPDKWEFTLEDYFKRLQAFTQEDSQETSVKSKQVGGDHYQKGVMQPWDIFLAWGLDPWAANVVKYILRFPHKNGLEDLQKAKHYVEFLIQHYEEVHEKYYREGQ